jgi:hypothetical protein
VASSGSEEERSQTVAITIFKALVCDLEQEFDYLEMTNQTPA